MGKIENNEKKTITCRYGVTLHPIEASKLKIWKKEQAIRAKNKGKEEEKAE